VLPKESIIALPVVLITRAVQSNVVLNMVSAEVEPILVSEDEDTVLYSPGVAKT